MHAPDPYAIRAGPSRPVAALAFGVALCLLASGTAGAQMTFGIALSGAHLGISVPRYPEFVQVPGYPVYYAPRLDLNLFFYDGLYWSYNDEQWYSGSWYDGPWDLIGREFVPLFVLRVPVRYYRQAPAFFRGWPADEAPRWGQRWGRDWQQRRLGWDRWDRHDAPRAAPLPSYQRDFGGPRYPPLEQQRALRADHYQYRPQDAVSRQHFESLPAARAGRRPAPTDGARHGGIQRTGGAAFGHANRPPPAVRNTGPTGGRDAAGHDARLPSPARPAAPPGRTAVDRPDARER